MINDIKFFNLPPKNNHFKKLICSTLDESYVQLLTSSPYKELKYTSLPCSADLLEHCSFFYPHTYTAFLQVYFTEVSPSPLSSAVFHNVENSTGILFHSKIAF